VTVVLLSVALMSVVLMSVDMALLVAVEPSLPTSR
jgi:hypothetical protein